MRVINGDREWGTMLVWCTLRVGSCAKTTQARKKPLVRSASQRVDVNIKQMDSSLPRYPSSLPSTPLSHPSTPLSPSLPYTPSPLSSSPPEGGMSALSSYDRKPLAPPPKFKKADLNDSLRSIISIDGSTDSLEGSSPESKGKTKFLLEHEKEESGKWKGKGKLEELNSSAGSDDSTAAVNTLGRIESSPSSSRRRGSSVTQTTGVQMDTYHINRPRTPEASSSSLSPSSRPTTPTKERSNSVSSTDSVGSTDSLVHKPKKSLLAGIFDKPKSVSQSQSPVEMKEKNTEKSKRLFSQPSVYDKDKKLYSRKPFQRIESYQTVKDKKYKAVLEMQQQRVLTELPLVIELQLIEEAYPIILKMCQEYIKNLGERHEITQTAIERLNLMAKQLNHECEFAVLEN